MKINITTDGTELSGYFNTSSLDLGLIDVHSCEEILAPHIINAIPFQDLGNVLKMLVEKLRMGGVIKIGGYDAVEFAKQILFYQISTVERNSLVGMSQCFITLDELVSVLESLGLTMKKKRLDGMYYLVEATR